MLVELDGGMRVNDKMSNKGNRGVEITRWDCVWWLMFIRMPLYRQVHHRLTVFPENREAFHMRVITVVNMPSNIVRSAINNISFSIFM